jgi:hypothetical protein
MPQTDAPSGARRPSVSIGVPVYNGEAFVADALASVAAQTFTDYEVVISDNASTDGTQAICEAQARRDPRIRYHRNPTNVGVDRNFDRCLELSTGEYFLILAHDDRLHPQYLERVVAVLEADEEVVFCHSRAFRMDETGAVVGTFDPRTFSDSPRVHERFRVAIAVRPSVACLGVSRASVLRQLPPLCGYPNSDAYRQGELALRGRLVEIPDVLFYTRIRASSVGNIPIYQRILWSDPSKAGAVFFPAWRRPAEYARAVLRSPLRFSERFRCFVEIARYMVRRGPQPLLRDLKPAAWTLLSRSQPGLRLLESWSRRRRHG